MIICASTECFPGMAYSDVFQSFVDLEFTAVEMAIHASGGVLRPADVLADLPLAAERLRASHRLALAALSVDIDAEGDAYYEQFTACCKLAKAAKVVAVVVPAAELGTPFNEEIERLREMVRIASFEGALVALKTQIGCMTQDPDTAVVLCDNVKGLGLTLDPSHFICGPHQGRQFDKVIPYTYHVHLRDSTKDKLQVRIGQGEVDYSRLIVQLRRANYSRGLSVHMTPMEDIDYRGELRKLRLLLESSL